MRIKILICLIAISTIAKAQELKKITRANSQFGEVYYVLKGDRSIKQGQYLKYFESMNMYDKSIEAYGNYDNNKKTGAWIYCDAENNANPLLAIGEFRDDMKVGNWVFFYVPAYEDYNIINLSGSNKHTKVTIPRGDDPITVSLDTIGIRTAAIGEYNDNKKVGMWSYYFKNGSLACKYDFNKDSMVYNNGLKSFDQLGGLERFKSLFHKSAFEKRINSQPFFVQNSSATFEIATFHDSINVKKLNSFGSIPFANTMEKIFYKMSKDWVNYDPRLEKNKLKISLNYVVDGHVGTITMDSIKPLN